MKINFSTLNVNTLSTLAKRVLDISEKPVYTVVKNHQLLKAVSASYTSFFSVLGKQTYSGKGGTVAEKDMVRDTRFNGMYRTLKGFVKLTDLPNAKEYNDLFLIFDRYGLDIQYKNYGDQTADMDKLVEILDQPDNQAKLTSTGLMVAFSLMKEAHLDFVDSFGSQMEANAELRTMSSATTLRKQLISDLRNYLSMVESMKSIEGWGELYFELNEAVKAARNSNLPNTPADVPTQE